MIAFYWKKNRLFSYIITASDKKSKPKGNFPKGFLPTPFRFTEFQIDISSLHLPLTAPILDRVGRSG